MIDTVMVPIYVTLIKAKRRTREQVPAHLLDYSEIQAALAEIEAEL